MTTIPKTLKNNRNIQFFDLNNAPQLLKVEKSNIGRAQIYLHLPAARSHDPADRKVLIETILLDVDKYGNSIEQSMSVDSADLIPNESGWAPINASEIVDIWLFKNPSHNFGVEFRVSFKVKTKNHPNEIPVGIQFQQGRNVS